MSPDHPQRVAAWLGEVFGGPKAYTSRYGGYERMISQHAGKDIREEWRARWVQLLCRAADDVGLPSDPEFRAAFVGYLERGFPAGGGELPTDLEAATAHAGTPLVVGVDRVAAGTMPCDTPWPAKRTAVLKRWIDSGIAR